MDGAAALAEVEAAGLRDEQALLLGREGRGEAAVDALLEGRAETAVARAVAFARPRPELWPYLVERCVGAPARLGDLLEHAADAGGGLDLADLVRRVPEGVEIPGLRDKLAGLLRARRHDVAIWQATRDVAKGDAFRAQERYLLLRNRGILCEPPHEFDDEGNIIVRPKERYY